MKELYCTECLRLVRTTPFKRCPRCGTKLRESNDTVFFMTIHALEERVRKGTRSK